MPSNLGRQRWLVIALSFVILARSILLVFQLQEERHPKPIPSAPSWPAYPGEELRFGPAVLPKLQQEYAPHDHEPLAAGLLERNFEPAAPSTGCLLDPIAMARGSGGTLTLRKRDTTGYWLADWSGATTMLSPAELPAAATAGLSDKQRQEQAAMLTAADCGGSARLSLGEDTVHALVNVLSGRPAPLPDPHQPSRRLIIPVNGLPPQS